MDKAQLTQAITDLLRRIPKNIASASINGVNEFRTWHTQTTKKISKSSLPQLQNLYAEVQSKYR
jgi:hypothetical protein